MSSEDDDFYLERTSRRFETRSTSRPRRRNSNSLRRRSRRYAAVDAFDKSRRGKFWYNLSAARFVAMCIFASLAAYEVFILRAPLATDAKVPPSKSRILVSTTKVQTPILNTVRDSAVTQQSTTAATSPARIVSGVPVPPEIPAPLAPTRAIAPASVSSIRSRSGPPSDHRRPVSDIPADSDVDGASSTKTHNARPTFRPLMRRSRTRASVTSENKIVTQSPASALHIKVSDGTGRPSPKLSSSASAPDVAESYDGNPTAENKGADPGAGENFWKWFQDTKSSDKEKVTTTLNCSKDYKRLCSMFYKYLRKYKIRSVFDVSCTKNLDWMPDILKKAGGELWGFKYYCSVVDDQGMIDAKAKLASIPFVEFTSDQWWRSGFPQNAELLFGWDTLPHIAFGRIWNFFVKARMSNIKYILVDNYPNIQNDPSPNRQFVNLRKHPFRFPAAKEVVQNVTEPGEDEKRQLLFYETSILPDNLQ